MRLPQLPFALLLFLTSSIPASAAPAESVAPRATPTAAPASFEPWSLGKSVRYVVPADRWLVISDLGRSAGLSVRNGMASNMQFLAAGAELAHCATGSRFGVPCPPGATIVAEANSGVRGYLTAEPLADGGPLPQDVLAKHAFINPNHRSLAHVTTVPLGYRLHLTSFGARADSPLQLLVDGEVVAELAQGGCRELNRICDAGATVELGTTDEHAGTQLGAVFGYFEALPGPRARIATAR